LRKAALLTFVGVDAFGAVWAMAMLPKRKDNTTSHEKSSTDIRIVISTLDIRGCRPASTCRLEKQDDPRS
jgi:hypothetical protein